MKVLALDCGGKSWGVACVDCNGDHAQVGAFQLSDCQRDLSREVINTISTALETADWKLEELEALVVATGPGSWTGLRIGLSTIKTLAQACSIPLAGVPSFDAVAQGAWRKAKCENETLVLVSAHCRPGEIYSKIYQCDSNYLGVAQPEWIGSPDLVADTLGVESLSRGFDSPPILCGTGARAMAELLGARGDEYSLVEVGDADALAELALAGAAKIQNGQADSPFDLLPLYLAPSNAERNLLRRL